MGSSTNVLRAPWVRLVLVLACVGAGALALAVVVRLHDDWSATPAAQPLTDPARAGAPAVRITPGGPVPSVPIVPPAPVAGGCKAVPSRCGYPDVTNTGPAPGTVLTPVPSQLRSGTGWEWSDRLASVQITGANAVLTGLDISGPVVIDAPNATISNSRISACGGADDGDVVVIRYRASDPSYRASGARVVHNTILGTPSGCTHRARSGVRDVFGEAPNAVVDGNNISGTGNGITIESSGTVANNWIHDLGHLPLDHHSGISNHGGAVGVLVHHNTVLLHGQSFAGGGGVSGAITVYADFGHAQNVTVQDNLISGGSYVVYGGESGDGYQSPATNVKFISNRFVCGDWLYGPVAAFDPASSGNVWTGNICDQSGAPVNP